MQPIVDDLNCRYDHYENGTTSIRYVGLISAWNTPEGTCSGVNIRAASAFICLLSIVINIPCSILAYKLLLARRQTPFNIIMVITPLITIVGNIFDLLSVISFLQLRGAELTHLPKVFYYTTCTLVGWMEGFRVGFIAAVTGRTPRWEKWFRAGIMMVGAGLGVWSIVVFVKGVKNGRASVGVYGYAGPYTFWFMIIGVTDVVLSALLLHLCYKQTALLRSFDIGQESTKGGALNLFKIACGVQIVVVIASGLVFSLATRNLGNTFAYLAMLSLPFQYVFLVYSIHVLQRMQHKQNVRRGGTPSSTEAIRGFAVVL